MDSDKESQAQVVHVNSHIGDEIKEKCTSLNEERTIARKTNARPTRRKRKYTETNFHTSKTPRLLSASLPHGQKRNSATIELITLVPAGAGI
jgi:hypothetical protein